MPIYDYQCTSCGHKAEVMRKVSAANTEACPQCGAEAFSKQLSAPSFQLNGSGWYATDFKNGAVKSSAKTEAAETKTEPAAAAPCATGCACH
jgi:putative FmdB family regulatory protein